MRHRELTTTMSTDETVTTVVKHDRTGGAPFFSEIHTENVSKGQIHATGNDSVSSIDDDGGIPFTVKTKADLKEYFKLVRLNKSIQKRFPDSPFFNQSFSKLNSLLLPKGVRGVHPKMVKKVYHDKTQYHYDDTAFLSYSSSVPFFDGVDTHFASQECHGLHLPSLLGLSNNYSTLFNNATACDSSQDYLHHDWFSLFSKFDESMKEFIPSSFLVGEDMAENDIFIDAFKLILNPTRALKVLVKNLKNFSTKYTSRNLGGYVKALKSTTDGHLLYKFAIAPAIDDFQLVMAAHIAVSSRLAYLRQARGTYVPIRVSKRLASAVSHLPLPTSKGETYKYVSDRYALAVIFAMGRCRDDLSFNDTWSAYLQYFGINKMVGLAWELVPMSFVIDWFTNCQERINYLTRLDTGSPFSEVTCLGHSLKKVSMEDLFIVPPDSSVFGLPRASSEAIHLASRSVSHYERIPGLPDTSGIISLDYLGPSRISSLGEIIFQWGAR